MRGNPHPAFDVAGAENVAWSRWCDTRRRKGEPTGNTNIDLNRRVSPRPYAGNVALTFGARGGVYIAGGISPRIVDFMARSEFRNRFEAKGRLQPYLKTIPTYVIIHPAAAFLGLKSLSAQ